MTASPSVDGFVLDNSVSMLWLLPNSNPGGLAYAREVLSALTTIQGRVPSLWGVEVANVIAKVENKGIVTAAQAQYFISMLTRLNIVPDTQTNDRALGDTLNLARRYKLSAYDAAYLELALRLGLPLATLDADLAQAARLAGVGAFALDATIS